MRMRRSSVTERLSAAALCFVLVGSAAACGSSKRSAQARGAAAQSCDYVAPILEPTPRPDIEIQFEPKDLQPIYENDKSVGLARVAEAAGFTTAPVLWASFHPLMSNRVKWDPDALTAYASNTGIESPGASIILMSAIKAPPATAVRFDPRGYFVPAGSAPAGSVDINVGTGQDVAPTFGLTAPVLLNGDTHDLPFVAARVGAGKTARFTMTQRLYAFVGDAADSGSILRALPADATAIDLAKGNHVLLNWCAGRFVVTQQS